MLVGLLLSGLLFSSLQAPAQQQRLEQYYQQASEATRRQDWVSAEQAYSAILRLSPERADATYGLGLAHHFQGKYEKATRAFEKTLQLDPEMIEANLFLGLDYYLLYEYEKSTRSSRAGHRRSSRGHQPSAVPGRILFGFEAFR